MELLARQSSHSDDITIQSCEVELVLMISGKTRVVKVHQSQLQNQYGHPDWWAWSIYNSIIILPVSKGGVPLLMGGMAGQCGAIALEGVKRV